MFERWFPKRSLPVQPGPEPDPAYTRRANLSRALSLAGSPPLERRWPIRPPDLIPGVVPTGQRAAIAMDSEIPGVSAGWRYAQMAYGGMNGFAGYQYLAMLATRAEFRAFASSLSTELTREWITLNSSETAGEGTKKKITELEAAMKEFHVQHVIQLAAEHDSYFGRGQIFIDLNGADSSLPLVLDPRTVKIGSLKSIRNVEPMWTSPSKYNALNPAAPDFYCPSEWWMLGTPVHASRLMTIITRPLPDILKPAFNFSGMSMSQLAEPYVENWLRTRQSVADLISNFSVTALKTSMDQVLSGGDDGTDLFKRAELFTLTRSNKGLMLLDKDREELVQVNVPLSGLSELQAQAQEHMCAVSREPAIVLTGISPTGLNASSEGEIRVFYDWIAAQQESFYRVPIETILKVMQLSLYGEIDPEITFAFKPLFQLTAKEEADVLTAKSTIDCAYIDRGVLDQQEVRERLARDTESGYQGLDIDKVIEQSETPDAPAPEDS